MLYFLVIIFSSIIGSFLNVCIYRIPRNESIIFPSSRCPCCKTPIPWYDNVPLLSYIFLLGKCRFCKKRILFRYFLVEAITVAAILILFFNFGLTYKFWIYSLITSALIVISFIDLEFQIIPDRISVGGIFLGIVLNVILPQFQNSLTWKQGLLNSLLGGLTGGGITYAMGVFGKMAFKKDSMGGGDVKLMAMMGAFLGWKKALLIFFLAPFFGSPAGIYIKFVKKTDVIPYGPYLSMACFVAMIWGDRILRSLFP